MKKNIDISLTNLFTAEVLEISGTETSDVVYLSKSGGVCKLQYTITGSGTVVIEAEESITNETFVLNETPGLLGSTLSAGSGIITYIAAGVPFTRFKITENGGAEAIVTLDIAVS